MQRRLDLCLCSRAGGTCRDEHAWRSGRYASRFAGGAYGYHSTGNIDANGYHGRCHGDLCSYGDHCSNRDSGRDEHA